MNCPTIEFLGLTKDILSQGALLRFQAKGWSMFPAIRHGDILDVERVRLEEIGLGDVIFYRIRPDNMSAHRVIKKFTQDDKTIFATRGDFTTGEEEKVYPEQILGRVKAIERNGKRIDISLGLHRLQAVIYVKFLPFLIVLRRSGGGILPYIHSVKAYRNLAKRLVKLKVSYQWEPSEGSVSGRCLFCKKNSMIIGRITIDDFLETDYPEHGWWIFSTWVYWPYRGLGIGRRLTEMVCDFAAQNGASEIKLLVFRDNFPATRLYEKIGFYKISIPEIDAKLKEESDEIRRQRIIMKKDLL